MTCLELQDVRIEVGRAEGERFSLHIPVLHATAGDRIALVGDSGAGKTTALEFMALLVRPAAVAAFRLRHGDQMVNLRPTVQAGQLHRLSGFRARHIGYVPQSGGLLPFLSAQDNATMTARAAGCASTDEMRRRLEVAMDRLDLRAHMAKRRGQLSGGERKRVAILRALAMPRRILLADEPTAGLDDLRATAAMEALLEFCAVDGSICIIATHDVELARTHGFVPHRVHRDPASGTSSLMPTADPDPAGRMAGCA